MKLSPKYQKLNIYYYFNCFYDFIYNIIVITPTMPKNNDKSNNFKL